MTTAKIETISPAKAERWLNQNTGNFRDLDPHRVSQLAKEIEGGNWELNGETIKFDAAGILLDGQHRLSAIAKSGKTVRSLVVMGVESNGKTVDRGKARTIAQFLEHSGIKNGKSIAAMARQCVAYEKGLWKTVNPQWTRVLDSEVFDFVDANEARLSQSLVLAKKAKRIITSSILGAVIFEGCRDIDISTSETAAWFASGLGEGKMLSEDDAVLHLRNRLLGQREHMKLSLPVKRSMAILAWNKTARGESCRSAAIRVRLTGPAKQDPPSYIEPIQADEQNPRRTDK